MKRTLQQAGCALTAIAWGLAAQAQTTNIAGSATDRKAASRSDPGAVSPDISDIVVTAQRRAESVSRAPLAITAITGDRLAQLGVVDADRLQEVIPSFHVQDRASGTNIAIRGVITVNPNPQGDPAVALSIDDIYVGRPNAANSDFLDLQRVEVLRGPQGTVYGRNATGGAVNVISNAPVFRTEGAVSAEFGNYGERHLTAVLNAPVSDTLAVRGAVDWNKHDGYIGGRFDDKDDVSSRLRLLYQPTDKVSLLLTGFYNHRGGHGPADVLYPYLIPSDPRANTVYPDNYGTRDSDYYGGSAKLTVDLEPVEVTYIGGYTVYKENSDAAQLGSLGHAAYDAKQLTQELRISSSKSATSGGDFSWLAGLYYFQEYQSYYNTILGVLGLKVYAPVFLTSTTSEPQIDARSYASLAQATYALSDTLRVTAGLRYTHDHKETRTGSRYAKPWRSHGFNSRRSGKTTACHQRSRSMRAGLRAR